MLYLTYDATRHQDGAGAQLLRIVAAFLSSVYFGIEYHHTPLAKIGYTGWLCAISNTPDLEAIIQYNTLFSLPCSSPLVFDEVLTADSVAIHDIVSLKEKARTTDENILLKLTYPIFLINERPEILLCQPNLSVLSWPRRILPTACIRIGVHIRRGEILIFDTATRYTPNTYYAALMRGLVKLLEENSITFEFHIHTESVTTPTSFSTTGDLAYLGNTEHIVVPEVFSEFDGIPCIHWHINERAIDSFTDLSTADVLIISVSAYSYLAAIMNLTAIVFYTPRMCHPPHPSWIVVTNADFIVEQYAEIIKKHCLRMVDADTTRDALCS